MNLELLDPFRRQNPDRIDSTLSLPKSLHFRSTTTTTTTASTKNPDGVASSSSKKDATLDGDWKAAYHIAFNRRGSYIAVAYGSGTIAVFDTVSRTVSSVYRPQEVDDSKMNDANGPPGHGITSISWSRRSRTLLAGSLGHNEVMLIDNTHPYGAEECCTAVQFEENKDAVDDDNNNSNQRSHSPPTITPQKSKPSTSETSFVKRNINNHHFTKPATLQTKINDVFSSKDVDDPKENQDNKLTSRRTLVPVDRCPSTIRRYPAVRFEFPLPIGSSLQVHPRDELSGYAVLNDGSITVFSVPQVGFEESQSGGDQPAVTLRTIYSGEKYHITCSAFDPHGEKIYAGTTDGKLLGFEVGAVFNALATESNKIPCIKPNFVIQIPGCASAWHIVVSRNGRYIIVNSSDAAVRLYNASECWTTPEEVEKPTFVFQDVVSKVRFASCDVSGDG
jgi:hypothetical protein